MDQEVLSSYKIIDAHAHIFPEKIVDAATVNIGKFYDLKMHCIGSSKMLIEEGSKAGVSKYNRNKAASGGVNKPVYR